MEGSAYIRPRMRNSVKTTFSWVLALGLVLIHVSPVGADWLAIHPYAHVSRATGEVHWRPDAPARQTEVATRLPREAD